MDNDEAASEKMAFEYLTAICGALDATSLKSGPRGDMGAALAALSAAQAQLISTLPDGRLRKQMRKKCADHLLQYSSAVSGDDSRGVSKPSLAVLPLRVH
jgi:hypothetical protein